MSIRSTTSSGVQARERIPERPRDPRRRDRVRDARRGRCRGSPRARPPASPATAPSVQSRWDGVLKSPVMNVGIPWRSAGRSARSVWRISGSRVARSFASTRDDRSTVAHQVRAVRIRREVHVGEREHAPGRDLRQHVLAARGRRVDQRIARDDVQAVAPVRPAERLRDRAACSPRPPAARRCPPASRLDRGDHVAEVDDIAAEPDVEGHDPHLGGGASWARAGAAAASSRRPATSATTRLTCAAYPRGRWRMTPRILLFDIDGTLVTTGGAGAVAWRQAFEELHGIPADIGQFTDAGMTDPDVGAKTFEAVLGRKPTPLELAADHPAAARAPARGGRRERRLQGAARRAGAPAPAQPRRPPARADHRQRRRRGAHQARARRPEPVVHVRRLRERRRRSRRRSCARPSARGEAMLRRGRPEHRDLRDRRHAARHRGRARGRLHGDRRRDRPLRRRGAARGGRRPRASRRSSRSSRSASDDPTRPTSASTSAASSAASCSS